MSGAPVPGGLVGALAQVQAKLPIVAKTGTANVKSQRTGAEYSYSYADLADVAGAVYPLLGEVGLAFICTPTIRQSRYVLAGRLEHTSGEVRSGVFPLPNTDDPQTLGSALTYGRRYLLGCLSGVVTDKDDDGQRAKTASDSPAAPLRRKQATKKSADAAPEKPAEPDSPSSDPAALRAAIGRAGKAKGLSIQDLEADFVNWSQGERIPDADSSMLQSYLDTLTEGASG